MVAWFLRTMLERWEDWTEAILFLFWKVWQLENFSKLARAP